MFVVIYIICLLLKTFTLPDLLALVKYMYIVYEVDRLPKLGQNSYFI